MYVAFIDRERGRRWHLQLPEVRAVQNRTKEGRGRPARVDPQTMNNTQRLGHRASELALLSFPHMDPDVTYARDVHSSFDLGKDRVLRRSVSTRPLTTSKHEVDSEPQHLLFFQILLSFGSIVVILMTLWCLI